VLAEALGVSLGKASYCLKAILIISRQISAGIFESQVKNGISAAFYEVLRNRKINPTLFFLSRCRHALRLELYGSGE